MTPNNNTEDAPVKAIENPSDTKSIDTADEGATSVQVLESLTKAVDEATHHSQTGKQQAKVCFNVS